MKTTPPTPSVIEPARSIPVIHESDICVIGGSCTGLFAAVRAARLGARVVIIEKDNCFGGVATNAMVNIWHSFWNTSGQKQIIAGLSEEVIDRLKKRNAVRDFGKINPAVGHSFNSEELKIELDELALESKLKIYFHTVFCAPYIQDNQLKGIFVENKSGRGLILAKQFIDASGDGDLAMRCGCSTYVANQIQPATTCARFSGWDTLGEHRESYSQQLGDHAEEFGLPQGFAWGNAMPKSHTQLLAATRVYGINPGNADDLTHAEIEGRRQIRVIQKIIQHSIPQSDIRLEALPSRIGLRESRHIQCLYQLTGDDVLHGRSFEDTIALGSYRVDIHHQDKPGITLRYLDGTEEYTCPGKPSVHGRWRTGQPIDPTYYQVPYRSMLPADSFNNLIVAGRMMDMDPVAHAGVRVMVNLNQTGEAAGVAAVLAMNTQGGFSQVSIQQLQKELIAGGSALEPTPPSKIEPPANRFHQRG